MQSIKKVKNRLAKHVFCACSRPATKRKASADVCDRCDEIERRMLTHDYQTHGVQIVRHR